MTTLLKILILVLIFIVYELWQLILILKKQHEPAASPPLNDVDPLINEAIFFARSEGEISTSMLQKKLIVGYARAARMLDQLEAGGYIGPQEGNSRRKVLK